MRTPKTNPATANPLILGYSSPMCGESTVWRGGIRQVHVRPKNMKETQLKRPTLDQAMSHMINGVASHLLFSIFAKRGSVAGNEALGQRNRLVVRERLISSADW